jgi:hypothetical protein
MKVRHGFVSNSSSSSTIVVVNPRYRATEADFLQALNNTPYLDMDPADIAKVSSDADILRKINAYLDVLKNGEAVWEETVGMQTGRNELSLVIEHFPGVHVIGHADAGPDSGQIVGIKPTKIKDIAQQL